MPDDCSIPNRRKLRRIRLDRSSRAAEDGALTGFSSGGVNTMDTFLMKPGLFGYLGSFSGMYNTNTCDKASYYGFDPITDLEMNRRYFERFARMLFQ